MPQEYLPGKKEKKKKEKECTSKCIAAKTTT